MMLHNQITNRPMNKIKYTCGQSCLVKYFNKLSCTSRNKARWLEHNSSPTNQGRKDFPAGNRNRKIPRGDECKHANGHTTRTNMLVRQLRWHRLPEHSSTFTSHVITDINAFLHIAKAFSDCLAHFLAHKVC